MADDSKAPSSSQDNRKNVAVLSLPDGRELEFPVEHDTIGDAISVNVKGAFAKAKVFFSSPGYADLSAARSQQMSQPRSHVRYRRSGHVVRLE